MVPRPYQEGNRDEVGGVGRGEGRGVNIALAVMVVVVNTRPQPYRLLRNIVAHGVRVPTSIYGGATFENWPRFRTNNVSSRVQSLSWMDDFNHLPAQSAVIILEVLSCLTGACTV
ncbi:hypothetical protein RRG08_044259 [Elysia crispata]|uniref:Uncharacterized protein n=1 Tax=Elysia crispata TaxID=231223 RepID=A0AAE0XWS0_9GAST|nr:hypothetical protein RRG08_044259 [Elysia crispata]